MIAEMSVASATQELGMQGIQQSQNGASDDSRIGDSTKTSNAENSPSPAKGSIELSFGPGGGDILSQPSSPPHNYRHSRAYRHFKNPPQPHMCIRVSTVAGEEVFINVLSWTRIVVPQEPTDPIPLYGGMKVPPGSPRCPPLVYAVMANPEVLKDSGRHSKDAEERRAMVELMCDFVEAMNPDLKLNRNAVILKDRDISGELKDVWNAVQAQRDREREEQIMQQHNHVPPPQQMFMPTKHELSSQNHQLLENDSQNSLQIINASDNKIMYMEFGPSEPTAENRSIDNNTNSSSPATTVTQSAINNYNANGNSKNSLKDVREKMEVDEGGRNVEEFKDGMDQTDSSKLLRNGAKDQQLTNNSGNATGHGDKINNSTSPAGELQSTAMISSLESESSTSTSTLEVKQTATSPISPTATSPQATTPLSTAPTTSPTNIPTTTTTTKKEKLGGFLPNSCIFPRFKNKNKDKNKEKEKDKDKEKEKEKEKLSNHNSKEKTILNSLKKTTTAATNAFTKSHHDDSASHAVKNCLNLEAEVEKLDLNKMDTPHANDVLIKVATPAAK